VVQLWILAAIAIPSYQGYVIKTQVKLAVSELARLQKTPFEVQVASSAGVSKWK